MKKNKLFLLVLSLPLLLVACNATSNNGKDNLDIYEKQTYASEVNYNLWSTFTSTKVLRNFKNDSDRYTSLGKQITIDMMQNETEGSQIIFSTEGNKFTYLDFELTDLVSSDNKILNKDNISIYFQKYITLPNSGTMNPNYDAGDMVPDMLLPYNVAKEFKENKIYGGVNQGITIEVNSKDVLPGTYSGNITLKVGDKTDNLPITVNVWDINFTGRRDFKTSFLIFRNELLNYEYDNSLEVVNNYVDVLNDYKVNSYVIQSIGENSVDYFKNNIKRQWNNMNYSSIVIPFDFSQIYRADDNTSSRCISYIQALVELSKEYKENIVKYAYFYPSSYDEADLDPVKSAASYNLLSKGGEIDKTLDKAIRLMSANGTFTGINGTFKEELIDSIYKIPRVFTNVNFKQEWVDTFNATFCPYMSLFNDLATTEHYQKASEKNSYGDLWAYSCMAPNYPYATFHIDDDNIAMRANAWMNKKIGINGYLYYEVNKIDLSNNPSELVDPYTDPLRYESVTGDGYLLYPGRKYNSNKPFASLRLMNYRDSMEDYDLLSVLERKLNSLKDIYDISGYSLENYINDIYYKMFKGATFKTTEKTFYELRKEIKNRIYELNNEDNILIIDNYDNDNAYTYLYTTNNDLEIIDSEYMKSTSGSGYLYKVKKSLTNGEIKISVNGKDYVRKVSKLDYLTDFKTDVSSVNKNDKTEISVLNNALLANIKSEYAREEGVIDTATMKFQPYISFNVNNLEQYDDLLIDYKLLSDEDVEFNIGINNGKFNILIDTNYCSKKDNKTMELNLNHINSTYLKGAKEIRFYFNNVKYDKEGKASLYDDRTLLINNIILKKEAK